MSTAPDSVFKAWIMVMAFVAATECKPLRKHLCNRLGENNVSDLEKWCINNNTTLDLIIDKVLEDVEHVNNRKYHNRKYMENYRCKTLRKSHVSACVMGKRREEKRREEEKNKSALINDFPFLTDSVFKTAYMAFLDMRKKMGKEATQHAEVLLLKKLHKDKVDVAIKRLEQSIENSWQGIFPLKEYQQSGGSWKKP